MAKKKRQGHYCRICGEWKANEKFSGKGHAKHICKSCQSLPSAKEVDMIHSRDVNVLFEIENEDIGNYTDIDAIPVFSERKKFTELDDSEKSLLRDNIRSQIIEHREHSGLFPNKMELIELKKRMLGLFEEEYNITLKNDATLRKFFQDNVTATVNKLQKKVEGTNKGD